MGKAYIGCWVNHNMTMTPMMSLGSASKNLFTYPVEKVSSNFQFDLMLSVIILLIWTLLQLLVLLVWKYLKK